METPNEFCYLSAATSPTSVCSIEDNLNFYSAPTSPISEASNALLGFIAEPTTPRSLYDHDHSSYSFLEDHDFEFETSRHFNVEPEEEAKNPADCGEGDRFQRQRGDSLPMMAFADELFCNGRVMALSPPTPKLKLPPGFRGGDDNSGGRSGVVGVVAEAEPKSPRSVLGLPFPRQCLWNDDFDPFMVALENVKEEEKGRNKREGKNGRRARSLSPLRARPRMYYMGLLKPERAEESGLDSNRPGKPNGSVSARWPNLKKLWAQDEKSPTHEMGSESLKHERKSPKTLEEPKGVVFARRVRRVRMGQEKPDKPTASPARRPKSEKGKVTRGSRGSYTRGNTKRQKIMRFLFRGSSSRKESSDEENKEVKHQSATLWKPTFLRRLSFRSTRQAQHNRDKKMVSRVAKVTLIQYRTRLSLCMGYGTRYVQ